MRTVRRKLAGVAAGALFLAARPALTQSAQSGEVGVQRFQPALGAHNLVTVAGARMDGEMSYSAGIFLNYARDPLRLRHCLPGPCSEPGATLTKVGVVRDLATADLMGALVVVPRLQLGLRLPVTYVSGEGVDTDQSSATFGQGRPGGLSATGLGDPAIEAKFRAVGEAQSPLVVGGAIWVTAPLGRAISKDNFLGESSPSLGLKAIVDGRAGHFFYALNAGGLIRQKASLGSLELGPELRLGGGGGYEVSPAARLLIEAFGSTNFAGSAGNNASELDGAVQLSPAQTPLQITLGGGAGLNQGLGAPVFRVFAGLMVSIERTAPVEKIDEHPDRDGDGIQDSEDVCPSEGGDVVRTPGRYFGCPHRDSDGDGITDSQDACPEQAGIKTADPKTNGCPDPDRDHDGIPNDIDKCPDLPETVNGIDDADGCPDTVPIKVEVRRDEIVVINDRVNFEFRSERIVGPRSFEALDLVAQVLREHPEIRRVEVAGHTDNVGPRDENLSLSERRAGSVVAYLMSKGVTRERLVARGYGTDQPLGDNGTEEGRSRNRRVEFKILMIAK